MKTFNAWLSVGILGSTIFGSQLATDYGRAMWGDRDMWWTPGSMALPLDQTGEAFQIYLGGELLQRHVERGTLTAVDPQGRPYRVSHGDLRVRLNNWNQTRASFLHAAVFSAFMLGMSLVCLGVGARQVFAARRAAKAGGA